jgi:hypothetical protein
LLRRQIAEDPAPLRGYANVEITQFFDENGPAKDEWHTVSPRRRHSFLGPNEAGALKVMVMLSTFPPGDPLTDAIPLVVWLPSM